MEGATLKNVLIVGDFADVNGGQAKVAIDSARLLASAGVSVTFFAASGPVSPLLEHENIKVICLDQFTLMENPNRLNAMTTGLWNRAAAKALQAAIEACDQGTSVLHCHGWAKALSPSIGPVLARAPMPVVYTMHEYFLACPNGGFYDYQRNEICHRKPLSLGCLTTHCDARHAVHKAWRVARSSMARSMGRLPGGLRHIIYISETQNAAMAAYLPKAAQLHHIPNPVERGGAPVAVKANDAFVFVGRLSQEKGAALFAEAAHKAGVRAVLVGEGPEADRIRQINPEAEITGWLSPDEVQEQLSQARALVFPSLWYECQPLVPIEALLRGIPVVCGSWGAASEVVEDGKNGVLYHSPDAPALAEALARVQDIPPIETDALFAEVSPERHLERLLALYSQLL